jgi:endonuclease I
MLGKSSAGEYAVGLGQIGRGGTLIRQRRIAAALFWVAVLLGRLALADAYDPPAGYYSTATGSGATLKQQLNTIVKTGHTPISYDSARTALQITDADPNNPGHILLVYNRVSLNVSTINPGGPIPGWNGTSWDREHTWPVSRGLSTTAMPDGSDLHALRPSTPSVNNSRSNSNFGGAYGAQPFGYVTDGGNSVWYPGNADAGMIARHSFYMAVRYDGSDSGTTDLELVAGNPANSGSLMGDLNRMIEWHFAAPPDSFERRRNQVIYDDYQHNRNAFIDRPEYAWSVFVDQANDSRITIAGTTANANGGSTRNVDLGRVFVGAGVPAAQSFTLNKAGTDGTYFEVTTAGAATSSLSGRFNAFRTNQTDSKSITVGLNTNTTTAGLRSGSVAIDNLDITTGGGTGRGANDANDTFNVSLTVLDHATPSFTNSSLATSLMRNFGTVTTVSAAQGFNFDVFNLTATPGFTANMDFDSVMASGHTSILTTNAAALAGSLSLVGGMGQTFTTAMSTAAVGSFSATYTLMFSDEDLPGAINKSLTLTLLGQVILAGDYNRDGMVDSADYLVWRKSYGQAATAYDGADGDGSGTIGDEDFAVWQANFGQTAGGGGGVDSGAVPEPAGLLLVAIALLLGVRRSLR